MRKGFTLIELVIVMVILGLLLGLSASFSFIMLDTLGLLTRQANLQESADVALSRISREVRRLKNDTSVFTADSATDGTPLVSVFSFQNINSVRITYQRNAGANTLERVIGSPPTATDILADKVTALNITFYDDSGTTIAAPAISPARTNIRRIEFELVLQESPHKVTAQTVVRPRNLRHESYMFF